MTSQWKPGMRAKAGRMSEDRAAWLRVILGTLDLYIKDWTTEEVERGESEYGPNIVLLLGDGRGYKRTFNVTSLTLDELEAMKELLALVFNLAEPIIRQRDQEARDGAARGDDAYTRSYRQVPQLVTREGPLTKYREGLLRGFTHVTSPDGNGIDLAASSGTDRPEVAEHSSEGAEAEDDRA